ncbi:thiolase C-terminal domain-containing protein [Alicycliphilus sp. T452]
MLEAVHQLRQEAGRRQLPKARTALVHAPGMVFSANTSMILGVQ